MELHCPLLRWQWVIRVTTVDLKSMPTESTFALLHNHDDHFMFSVSFHAPANIDGWIFITAHLSVSLGNQTAGPKGIHLGGRKAEESHLLLFHFNSMKEPRYHTWWLSIDKSNHLRTWRNVRRYGRWSCGGLHIVTGLVFFFLSMCTFARHDESQLLKTIIGDTNFLQGAAELGRVHEAEIQTSDDPECNIFVAVTALGWKIMKVSMQRFPEGEAGLTRALDAAGKNKVQVGGGGQKEEKWRTRGGHSGNTHVRSARTGHPQC